jgi:DNA (cytosine-5)-methyltransferase 1
LREDIKNDKLKLNFNFPRIIFQEVMNRNHYKDDFSQSKLTELYADYWFRAKLGSTVGRFNAVGKKLDPLKIAPTCLASSEAHYHPIEQRMLSKNELSMLGSYPLDYNFNGSKFRYLIGMSVPPVVMANIATQIKKQWLD